MAKIYSVCGMCTVRCPIEVDVKHGEAVWIQGNGKAVLGGGDNPGRGERSQVSPSDHCQGDHRPRRPAPRGSRPRALIKNPFPTGSISMLAEAAGSVVKGFILWSDPQRNVPSENHSKRAQNGPPVGIATVRRSNQRFGPGAFSENTKRIL